MDWSLSKELVDLSNVEPISIYPGDPMHRVYCHSCGYSMLARVYQSIPCCPKCKSLHIGPHRPESRIYKSCWFGCCIFRKKRVKPEKVKGKVEEQQKSSEVDAEELQISAKIEVSTPARAKKPKVKKNFTLGDF